MRRKLLDGLYVGSLADCRALADDPQGFAVVHACKNPCHAGKCGNKPAPDSPGYLSLREDRNLYLNLIDPELPLFQRKLFDDFLAFAREQWVGGQPLLIHCNKGQSRAPTLALLFMAKVLHAIPAGTYDDAWIGFEKFTGEKYTPGEGLERWMRDHWSEIDGGRMLPHLETGSEQTGRGERIPVSDVKIPNDPESVAKLAMANSLVHFGGWTKIEDKEHKWISPTPNALQFDIDEAYQWCLEQKVPCRLIVLKPRQVGCSTKVGHTCYHHMRRFKSDMLMMGDVAKRTLKVFQIFNDFASNDAMAGRWDSTYQYNTLRGRFTYADGTEGVVEHDTALDPKAGISGTRQVVWLTEAARYMKASGRDKTVITAVLNSLADVPNSLAVAESTAEGAAGWYYETWQGAVSLEDRKKGIVGNGWIRIFAPWFAFKEHELPKTPDNLEYFRKPLDQRERRGISLYGWTARQVAWRRMKIAKTCANDERKFDQDFPEDDESCFLASGRPRFDVGKLSLLEARAKVNHPLAKVGAFERSEGGEVAFIPKSDGGAWAWMIEDRRFGCRYIAWLDPCTGAQNQGSQFPDSHACGVWREGYMENNVWHKPRLVAVIDVPNGCRWENTMLAERLKAMADYFGGCMIVPETGNGLGALHALQIAKADIYEREKMDAMYPGQRLRVAGWETNTDTRPVLVDSLADAIAEDAVEIEYLPAVRELRTFCINDRGKAEAKSGCHDDWVMGLGIGKTCMRYAKTLLPPQRFKVQSDDDESGMSRALS